MDHQYALFFDIDGTLVSFKTHQIPPSTILALTQAKANGARIYISTGRPYYILNNLKPIEHLIDGYITTNGAHCFVGERTVRRVPIAPADVDLILNDCRQNDDACLVCTESRMVPFNSKECIARIFEHDLAVTNIDYDTPLDVAMEEPVYQLSAFFDAHHESSLMPQVPHCVSGRWHPEFTDITHCDADKGKGLIAMAAAEGIDMSHTIAFGDGGNDMSIILKAGTGIAMGNAIPELKAVATYVTTSVDDDGILLALRHYGII